MDFAIFFAWTLLSAWSTVTTISVSAPSPSDASCLVKSKHTFFNPSSKAFKLTWPAWPDDRTRAISLVEVSVSTLSALNVVPTTFLKMRSNSAVERSASVIITAIIVAMFGSIIPTPFAMPTMEASST